MTILINITDKIHNFASYGMIEKRSPLLPTKEYFSTGEAAVFCSVTPDTVLKWIRARKIPAHRTPGGHHRIPRGALLQLLGKDASSQRKNYTAGSLQYCWEFYSEAGSIPDGCRKCIVYRSRSRRCYEMSNLPADAGHAGLFCKATCDECEYFRMVQGQRPNVLIVTDQPSLQAVLQKEASERDFNLRFADCEYRCSMLVEQFRPDYVVIDCSLGADRSREFATLLYEDPRIPFVRVVLVGNDRQLPKKCDRSVYAMIERYLTTSTLSELIDGARS